MVPARRKMSVMGRVVDFRALAIDVRVCVCVWDGLVMVVAVRGGREEC